MATENGRREMEGFGGSGGRGGGERDGSDFFSLDAAWARERSMICTERANEAARRSEQP